MIPGQQSTVGDPGICHSHVEVEHARCPHLHGKDIIWEVSVLPERSDPCRLWLDFVSPARATERLNHSTHVHLAVQHEPSFCGVPMQSILANHIVSGGTPSSRLEKLWCPMYGGYNARLTGQPTVSVGIRFCSWKLCCGDMVTDVLTLCGSVVWLAAGGGEG